MGLLALSILLLVPFALVESDDDDANEETNSPPPDEVFRLSSEADEFEGTSGNDLILGRAGFDDLSGLDGNDTINGSFGKDVILGGDGNDELNGEEWSDVIAGGDGDDRLSGGIGEDFLFGEAGDDVIRGGDAEDLIYGGDGEDTLRGGAGGDAIFGDVIFSENITAEQAAILRDNTNNPDDFLAALDEIAVEEFDDGDADILFGDEGDDLLIVGQGDTASGGEGDDIFVIRYDPSDPAPALAVITDLEFAENFFVDPTLSSIPPFLSVEDDANGNAILSANGTAIARLDGIPASSVIL